MQDYQREFLDFALDLGVLRFGQFTLKSGRVSPYFFNAGLFNTGYAAAKLGRYYAAAIAESRAAGPSAARSVTRRMAEGSQGSASWHQLPASSRAKR